MLKVRYGTAAGICVAAILFCFPHSAHADAGITMMPVRYPGVLLYLLPVIVIEAIYLQHHLETSPRRTLFAVTSINLVTVGLGFPLSYGIYAGLNSVVPFPQGFAEVFNHVGWLPMWMADAVLPDWSGLQHSVWAMLAMFLLLLFPGYWLTGVVKSWAFHSYDLLNFRGDTKDAVWRATRLSYMFLAGAGCILLYLIYTRTT